jgi:hypothetical protein
MHCEDAEELAHHPERRVRHHDAADRLQQLGVGYDARARVAEGKGEEHMQHAQQEGVHTPKLSNRVEPTTALDVGLAIGHARDRRSGLRPIAETGLGEHGAHAISELLDNRVLPVEKRVCGIFIVAQVVRVPKALV